MFIRELGKNGLGPGEYESTIGLFNESILACYFIGFNGNLDKNTWDGVFKGNFRIPGNNESSEATVYPMSYSFINDSLLVCDLLISTGTEPNSMMIFSEKGKLYRSIPNYNILKAKQNLSIRTGEMNYFHFKNRLFRQNLYNDTVFEVTVDNLLPYFVLNRAKFSHTFESKWWSLGKQLQSNFIYLPVYSESSRYL